MSCTPLAYTTILLVLLKNRGVLRTGCSKHFHSSFSFRLQFRSGVSNSACPESQMTGMGSVHRLNRAHRPPPSPSVYLIWWLLLLVCDPYCTWHKSQSRCVRCSLDRMAAALHAVARLLHVVPDMAALELHCTRHLLQPVEDPCCTQCLQGLHAVQVLDWLEWALWHAPRSNWHSPARAVTPRSAAAAPAIPVFAHVWLGSQNNWSSHQIGYSGGEDGSGSWSGSMPQTCILCLMRV